jgi:choline kinase
MKCLIIAAGRGSRIANLGNCKPLLTIGGVPLIQRVIDQVWEAGVRDFLVVTGYRGDEIGEYLDNHARDHQCSIETLHNRDWQKKNGVSVLTAAPVLKESFLLLMADHLFDPSILRDLVYSGVREGAIKLAVDRRIRNNPLVDLGDVTRVWEEQGRILQIGKELPRYNAFDTGMFLCTPALFRGLEAEMKDQDVSLSEGVAFLARQGYADIFDIGARFWLDVDDEKAFRKAEGYLQPKNSVDRV